MAFKEYESENTWLDTCIKTAFPDGAQFEKRSVKLYLSGSGSLSLEDFLSQGAATANTMLMYELSSFEDTTRNEGEPKQDNTYSVFVRTPKDVRAEKVVNALRDAMQDNERFTIEGRLRRGRVRSGVSLRDHTSDEFEITIVIT